MNNISGPYSSRMMPLINMHSSSNQNEMSNRSVKKSHSPPKMNLYFRSGSSFATLTKPSVPQQLRVSLNEQLITQMHQRQVIEAVNYVTKIQPLRLNENQVTYEMFYNVFFYLGTFTKPYLGMKQYESLPMKERSFAERLWDML